MLSLTRTFLYGSLVLAYACLLGAPAQPIPSLEIPLASNSSDRAGGLPGTSVLDWSESMKQQLQTQTNNVKKLESQLSSLEDQLEKLTAINTDLSKKNDDLTAQYNAATARNTALTTENKTLSTKLASLQSEASGSKQSASVDDALRAKAALSTLQKQYDALSTENASLKTQISTLKSMAVPATPPATTSKAASSAKPSPASSQNIASTRAAVATSLRPMIKALAASTSGLEKSLPVLAKRLAGQRLSLQQMATYRSQIAALQKQLDQAQVPSDLQSKLEDVKEELSDAAETNTQKDDQIARLQQQIALVTADRDKLQANVQQLTTGPSSPAYQIKAQFLTYQRLVSSSFNQVKAQLNTLGQGMNSLSDRVQTAKSTSSKFTDLAHTVHAFSTDLKEYIMHVGQILKSKKDSGPGDSGKQIADLKDQIEELTHQYSTLSATANSQIAFLQNQLQASGGATSNAYSALQQRLDQQQENAAQQALVDAKLRDAALNAKLDLLSQSRMSDVIGAQNSRITDTEINNAKIAASAAGSGAAMATSTALVSGLSRSSSPGIDLSQLVAGLSRQPGFTQQFASTLPTQYQGAMMTLAGMPTGSVPTSQAQLQQTMSLIVRNHDKYMQAYTTAIQLLQNPTNTEQRRNQIMDKLQNTLRDHGNYLYTYGRSSGSSQRAEAISKLTELINQVENPLLQYDVQLKGSGQSAGLVPSPDDTTNLLKGFVGNLQALSAQPSMPLAY